MNNVLETAFFVSSEITFGVQMADLVASCMRFQHELALTGQLNSFTSDPFVSAIKRYYAILCSRAVDFNDPVLGTLPGIYRMSPKFFLPKQP